MKSRFHNLLCAIVILPLATVAAHADTIYTTQSAFNAATTGATTVDFNGIETGTNYVDEPSGITLGALTFTAGPLGPNNFIFVLGPDVYGFGTSAISAQGYLTDADDDLHIALSGSATAVAFDFIVDPGAITVNFSDGTSDSFAASTAPPASIFLGITASGGITSVDIAEPFSLGTASLNLIDFTTASILPTVSPSATPEPESLALVFTGLAGLAGALRTRLVRRP